MDRNRSPEESLEPWISLSPAFSQLVQLQGRIIIYYLFTYPLPSFPLETQEEVKALQEYPAICINEVYLMGILMPEGGRWAISPSINATTPGLCSAPSYVYSGVTGGYIRFYQRNSGKVHLYIYICTFEANHEAHTAATPFHGNSR